MMKKSISSILFLIVLPVISFGQIEAQEYETFEFDISEGFKNNKKLRLSEICDSTKYVSLETTIESIVSVVSDVFVGENQIIILDGRQNKILRFDHDGKYIGQIGRNGRGPGEYNRIVKFEVNITNRVIYVFDLTSKSVIKYDFEGKYLGTNKNPLLGFWVTMIHDEYFVYFDPARSVDFTKGLYKAIITDLDGKILKKYKRLEESKEMKFKSPCSMQSTVYSDGTSAYYWEVTSDSILRVTSDLSIWEYASIKQGKKSFPKKKMDDASFYIKNVNSFSTIYSLFETQKYIFGHGIDDFEQVNIVFNKDSKECNNVNNNRQFIVNDIDNGPGFWPTGKADSKTLFHSFHAIQFEEWSSQLQSMNMEMSPYLARVTKNLEPTDNPIIILAKLKE